MSRAGIVYRCDACSAEGRAPEDPAAGCRLNASQIPGWSHVSLEVMVFASVSVPAARLRMGGEETAYQQGSLKTELDACSDGCMDKALAAALTKRLRSATILRP